MRRVIITASEIIVTRKEDDLVLLKIPWEEVTEIVK
jgi:hypothetical protein